MFNRTSFLIIFSFVLALSFIGCGLQGEKDKLKKELAEVKQKAQELDLKEKELAAREAILNERQKDLDSISEANDTLLNNYPNIPGNYSARMTCTKATCAGFAIGDVKTEQWSIYYKGNMVIAKAKNNKDELIRVYTGRIINDGDLLLTTNSETESNESNTTKMIIKLKSKSDNTLEGTREIIQQDNCQVVYSLNLRKQKS